MKTLTNRSKSINSHTATALLTNAAIAGVGGAFKLYRRTLVSELVTAAAACTARIITNQVRQTFTSTVAVKRDMDRLAYAVLLKWIVANCKSAKASIAVDEDSSGFRVDIGTTNEDKVILGVGDYWFTYKLNVHSVRRKYTVHAEVRDVEFANGGSDTVITVTVFGDGKRHMSDFLRTMLRDAKSDRQAIIFTTNLGGGTQRKVWTSPRDFSNVILKPEVEHKLERHMKWFKDNYQFYKQHGLPYKTSILLKGPPGTGKTSLCRAIAHYFGYEIYMLSLSGMVSEHRTSIPEIPEHTLVMIEDIDKNIPKDLAAHSKESESLRILMQMLDGMFSQDNTVFVLTTNFPELLPMELIRPGRINLKLDIGLFTMSEALRMAKLYDVPSAVINSLDKALWEQPAALHEFLLDYYNIKRNEQ